MSETFKNIEYQKIINDFLPNSIFDAHMHVSHIGYESVESNNSAIDLQTYYESVRTVFDDRKISCNIITYPVSALKNQTELEKSYEFIASQLNIDASHVGEIIIMPNDSVEDIQKRIIHPRIRGLKCYWIYSKSTAGDQSDIGDYLPESAWELANERGLFITLHMVKDKALADRANLDYIKTMAKRYPNAKLILAHSARAFAAWTAFNTIDELVPFDNIFFDFAAICESSTMAYIIKKAGIKRCMWGSDYPVSDFVGRSISIGNTFHWLLESELKKITKKQMQVWKVLEENIMALYHTSKILDLTKTDVEDVFYNNAINILK